MKHKIEVLLITVFLGLLIISTDVQALDKVVLAPTADIIGNKGFISGELIGSSYRQIEGLYNINSTTAVGGIIRDSSGKDPDIGLKARVVLARENEIQPAISVGLSKEDLYIAASKDLGYGFRGHFGLGNGGFGGLFLGFNKILNPVSISTTNKPSLPIINLKGEYINEEVNFAVQMNLQDNINVELGLIDMDSLKIGIGYLF